MSTNYRYVATQFGDSIKYSSSVNEIDRIGSSLLTGVVKEEFPNESIKGYGNAVVPQVVFEIFKVIQKIDYDRI